MTTNCLYIFVDTNCFIHLLDIKDIPWKDKFPGFYVYEIIATPIVIDELDKFKVDREDRRRTRSRLALQMIEAASAEPGHRLIVREKPFEIALRISVGHKVDWEHWPQLDPSRPDHQLVGAALAEDIPGPKVLLSFDTGPLIRARFCNLDALSSPVEWQLPAQPDESSKTIAQLKRELEFSRSTKPRIEARFVGQIKSTEQIRCRIPHLRSLPDETCARLMRELKQKHPRKELNTSSSQELFQMGLVFGYSARDVENYYLGYQQFLDKAEKYFRTLHQRVANLAAAPEVAYEVANTGAVTASNLLVEFQGPDQALLFGSVDDLQKLVGSIDLPDPPTPPEPTRGMFGRQTLATDIHRYLGTSLIGAPRDPTKFYWQQRPDHESAVASVICSEFRPARLKSDSYRLYLPTKAPYEGPVALEIDATNMAEPVKLKAILHLVEEDARWADADVQSVIDNWIADIVREAV
jgi:PIN domain